MTVTSDGGPGVLDLVIHQGADFRKTIAVADGTGAAIDLTGFTAAIEIATAEGVVLVSLSSGAGLTLGGAAGTIAVVIDDAATAALPRGRHGYDLIYTSPGGIVTALLTGGATVQRGYAGVP